MTTAFYIKTDQSVAGPFSGVELREAALARIIASDAAVGGTSDGPWHAAAAVGLFNNKGEAVPHPADVDVPEYHVQGMSGAFQGPFKLRELIGFAARGMLPPTAQLKLKNGSEPTDGDWASARKLRILDETLSGRLVLVDKGGKLVLRSSMHGAPASGDARAPIELASSVDRRDSTAYVAPAVEVDPEFEAEQQREAAAQLAARQAATEEATASKVDIEQQTQPKEESILHRLGVSVWNRATSIVPRRVLVPLFVTSLLLVGVGTAFSAWKNMGMPRHQVIGQWISYEKSTEETPAGQRGIPRLAVSFQEDGGFQIFNARGNSWSGKFVWNDRRESEEGFDDVEPFSTEFCEVAEGHQHRVMKPSDGHLEFFGNLKNPVEIDGVPVRDLFVRREGSDLLIGYLAGVDWNRQSRTMRGGWVRAVRARPPSNTGSDIPADQRVMNTLLELEPETGPPEGQYGILNPPCIRDAIELAKEGIEVREGDVVRVEHQTVAFSHLVNAAYLINRFGIPDEVRQLYRFETPRLLKTGPSFRGSQMVRYGQLRLILSTEGQILFVIVNEPAPKSS